MYREPHPGSNRDHVSATHTCAVFTFFLVGCVVLTGGGSVGSGTTAVAGLREKAKEDRELLVLRPLYTCEEETGG